MSKNSDVTENAPTSVIEWLLPLGTLIVIAFGVAQMVRQHYEMKQVHDASCANYERVKSRIANKSPPEDDPELTALDQALLTSTKYICDNLPPW